MTFLADKAGYEAYVGDGATPVRPSDFNLSAFLYLARTLGGGSLNSDGTPQDPSDDQVTTTASQILAPNENRVGFLITNHSNSGKLKLHAGDRDASPTSGIVIVGEERSLFFTNALAAKRISGIATSGTVDYTITEFVRP